MPGNRDGRDGRDDNNSAPIEEVGCPVFFESEACFVLGLDCEEFYHFHRSTTVFHFIIKTKAGPLLLTSAGK